ncbi:MAG: DUF4266 domain-containing protein [Thermochromatium sp.]
MITQHLSRSLMLLTPLLAGCAAQVAPWERGHLARPEMALEPYPLEAGVRQYVFFSKESVSGGYGLGGGGCGCN